jgi:hypothetical protein
VAFVPTIQETFSVNDTPSASGDFICITTEAFTIIDSPFARGWIKIIDSQGSNFTAINNTQTPNWNPVDANQTPGWTPINDDQ